MDVQEFEFVISVGCPIEHPHCDRLEAKVILIARVGHDQFVCYMFLVNHLVARPVHDFRFHLI